jgi:hypothetical protein
MKLRLTDSEINKARACDSYACHLITFWQMRNDLFRQLAGRHVQWFGKHQSNIRGKISRYMGFAGSNLNAELREIRERKASLLE